MARDEGDTVTELLDFLRAQLADDERAAPLAAEVMALRPVTAGFGARLLREVDAKRRILDIHAPYEEMHAPYDCSSCGDVPQVPYPCDTLRLLALPYDSHPDYRPEWHP